MGVRGVAGWSGVAAIGLCVALSIPVPALGAGAGAAPPPGPAPAASGWVARLAALPGADYVQKQEIVSDLARSGEPRARVVLSALLDGRLLVRGADHALVVAPVEEGGVYTDAASGAALGVPGADAEERIGINNQLRKVLRGVLARFQLDEGDPGQREAAVREIARSPDAEGLAALRAHLEREPDARVQTAILAVVALADLDSGDAARRLEAVHHLAQSLDPDVAARLAAMAGTGGEVATEPDARVREAAAAAVRRIAQRRSVFEVIQTFLFGLSQGSILVLAAIGLAVTFGVMGVINMAHGELMMLGAYTTFVVQQCMPGHLAWSIAVAVPSAFLVSGAVGVLIERGIVRFLYGRPLETLLATFGVSLLLQQAVRDIFTANNRAVVTPDWLAGSLEINEALAITYNHLYIIVFTLAVFFALLLVLRTTRFGLELRAVAQNRAMAKAMGIQTERIDALTFGLGSGIAGVAGVALSQLTNVGPNLGQNYIVDSFMVVVFGGVGSLWGTLAGGTALGVVNKLLEPAVGAVVAKILLLVFLILFIQRRPRGLFPQRGRVAES